MNIKTRLGALQKTLKPEVEKPYIVVLEQDGVRWIKEGQTDYRAERNRPCPNCAPPDAVYISDDEFCGLQETHQVILVKYVDMEIK